LQQQNAQNHTVTLPPVFLSRPWRPLPSTQTTPRSTIKVMSWNVRGYSSCFFRTMMHQYFSFLLNV
jgi:hypothetical protein